MNLLSMPKTHVGLAAAFTTVQSAVIALMQVAPAIGGEYAILSVIAVVNGLLSIGVLTGAVGLAYGYGKLNARVEVMEIQFRITQQKQDETTGLLRHAVERLTVQVERLVAIQETREKAGLS